MLFSKCPKKVIEEFYEAETRFMKAGGSEGGASFDDIASTLDPDVVLHQSPDLPFGGEYVGHQRYKDWANAMSAVFSEVDASGPEFFENGDKVVIACTLVTRIRSTGQEMKLPMIQSVTVKQGKIVDFRPFYWNVPEYVAAADTRKALWRASSLHSPR